MHVEHSVCLIRTYAVIKNQLSFITIISYYLRQLLFDGARGGAVGRRNALQDGRSRVRIPVVSLDFFIDIFLPAALWPWG